MRSVIIGSKYYELPESWDDITISKACEWLDMAEVWGDTTPGDWYKAAGRILAGIPETAWTEHPAHELRPVWRALAEFLKTPENDPVDTIKIGKEKFTISKSILNITFEQLSDADKCLFAAKHSGHPWRYLSRIMACLYMGKDEVYSEDSYNRKTKLFDDAPASVGWGALDFFFLGGVVFMKGMQSFSVMQTKATTTPASQGQTLHANLVLTP